MCFYFQLAIYVQMLAKDEYCWIKIIMSVYIIFPDLGNTKLHIFVGLSLQTPCALYSVLIYCTCVIHRVVGAHSYIFTTIWCHQSILYNERVTSNRLFVKFMQSRYHLSQQTVCLDNWTQNWTQKNLESFNWKLTPKMYIWRPGDQQQCKAAWIMVFMSVCLTSQCICF